MKKIVLILTCALLTLSLFGCNQSMPTISTSYIPSSNYERLEYSVVESGTTANLSGTLVMEAERIIKDTPYTVTVIDNDGVEKDQGITVENGSIILKSALEFNGDTMESVLVTDANFRPIYSYKTLKIKAEETLWINSGAEPACVSYALSTVYEKGTNKAVSNYLRQQKYGDDKSKWKHVNYNFDNLPTNNTRYWDVNQTYYAIRFVDTLQKDNFQYTFYMPMALESNTKYLICRGAKGSKALSNFPYVEEKYKTVEDFALTYTKVTITPSGEAVNGSSIEVYYAREDLHSSSQTDLTKDGIAKRIPVLIVENQSKSTITSDINPDKRGTITYSLTNIVTEK